MPFKKERVSWSPALTVIVVLFNLSFQGCCEIKNIPIPKIDSINKNNYLNLNGQYSNSPSKWDTLFWIGQTERAYQPKSFWNSTYHFLREKPFANTSGLTVSLSVETKRKLSLTLYQTDTLIATRIIRGKIKDGYFCVKSHFAITPFIPLVFGYSGFSYRIGKRDSTLLVDYRWKYWGFAILAGRSGRGQTRLFFNKK